MNGSTRIGTLATAACAAVLLLAGCDSKSKSDDSSSVVTPPASATIGSSGSGTTTGSTRPPATHSIGSSTAAPTTESPDPTTETPTGPAARYETVVGAWQSAQSRFLRQATSGGANISAEHRWAATFLPAERRFAAALDPAHWPARARSSLSALRRVSSQQQRRLRAMTQASGPGEFTSQLGAYSTSVGTENHDAESVRRVLGS